MRNMSINPAYRLNNKHLFLIWYVDLFLQIHTACREAYTQPDEQYACNMGCHNQVPFAEQRQDQVASC